MPDYAQFRLGGVTFPLTASTSNSLLRDSDPALYYMLDFFAEMIRTHLGSRLAAQATVAGLTISNAVAMRIPYDPAPYLLEEQLKFPLLAVYRKQSTFRGNISRRHHDGEFEVAYILPPLSAAQAEQLLPILRSVGRVLDNRAEMGFDPTYTPPGGSAGALVWSTSYASLEAVQFLQERFGPYAGMGELVFPAWLGTLKATEGDEYIEGSFEPFNGANITEDLASAGEATYEDFVEAKTYPAPSLTSIAPTSGDDAGGTSVTLTGTQFRSGARVFFGLREATSVSVVSSTSITCVTPANSAGVYDVTVSYLDDGQSDTLESAFTYT